MSLSIQHNLIEIQSGSDILRSDLSFIGSNVSRSRLNYGIDSYHTLTIL